MANCSYRDRNPENLWIKAIETLPEEDQRQLNFVRSDKSAILQDVLQLVEGKRTECMKRRWKYKRSNGDIIILRDVMEKIVEWVDRFKAVGDNAVQYDPGHAALPWAVVRFLLQVSYSNYTHGFILTNTFPGDNKRCRDIWSYGRRS